MFNRTTAYILIAALAAALGLWAAQRHFGAVPKTAWPTMQAVKLFPEPRDGEVHAVLPRSEWRLGLDN